MAELVSELDACDAIVLVSPIYFGQLNGPAKTFIDRIYYFFNPAKEGASIASKSGKKASVIYSCGNGSVDDDAKVAEAAAGNFGVIGALLKARPLFVATSMSWEATRITPSICKQSVI